ncbi:hypothetical protein BVRB_023040, partial [Beta vulgaris subsp. vulgaris]
PYELLEPPNSY